MGSSCQTFILDRPQVGDMKVYRTGSGPKCTIWCYDIYGFEGGRTRQLCDMLADSGYLVILPDFFRGDWRGVSAPDLTEWLVKQSDWYGSLQADVCDTILPYARAQGAKVFGLQGWGQLSSSYNIHRRECQQRE